jgi:hypothetical protein
MDEVTTVSKWLPIFETCLRVLSAKFKDLPIADVNVVSLLDA